MKALAYMLAAGVAWVAAARGGEEGARAAFARGEKAYAKGEYGTAAEAFLEAASGAAEEGLDADAARFNALVASEAAGDAEGTEKMLSDRVASPDVGLQAEFHFNRGNAWMAKAAAAESGEGVAEGGGVEAAAGYAERAVGEWREAVLRDGGNVAYKQNYELGLKKLEELKTQMQENSQGKDGQDQEQDNEDGQEDSGQSQSQEGEGDDGEQQQEAETREGGEQEQQQAQEGQDGDGEEREAQEAKKGEEMSEEEAALLMDAMKDQEQQQRDRLRVMLGRPVPVEKDW